MSLLNLTLAELNELPKSGQSMALAEINVSLEKLSAQERVQWALENMPGEFALSSSFGSRWLKLRPSNVPSSRRHQA